MKSENLKGLIFYMIFLFLILVVVFLLRAVGNDKNKDESAKAISVEGFKIIEQDREFSSVTYMDGFVYAGGVEGVLKINCENRQVVEELKANIPLIMAKALLVDKDGWLWIGHQNGITKYKEGEFRTYTVKDGLMDNRTNDFFQDDNGVIWAGTFGGAAYFKNDKWQCIAKKDGLIDDNVNVLLKDRHGYMWFASYTAIHGGVSIMKDRKFKYFNVENGLCHNSVTSLLQDTEDRIWVGGGMFEEGGATRFVFDKGEWHVDKILKLENGLAGEKVRHIYQDKEKRLWFCSEYDGIAIFDEEAEKRLAFIDVSSGLSDNEVKDMLTDPAGNLWLATRRGITVIDKAKLNQIFNLTDYDK